MVLSELLKSQGGTPLVWGPTGECGQTIQAEEAPCTTAWNTTESRHVWKTVAAQGKGLAYVESKMGHSF